MYLDPITWNFKLHNPCKFLLVWKFTVFGNISDVKGGCLYGSNMGHKPPGKYKGVQVFTYKELEIATNKFSEANVTLNEGYGVVYRGTLSDGTVAAIKMLHRAGKQGERAFRIEASDFF